MSDAFLGVSRSVTGRAWRLRPADEATTRALGLKLGLSEPLARAIAARGIDGDGAANFLNPTLRAQFPDPSSFAGMEDAVQVLLDALEADAEVVIFADYDVDGATSAAQLVRWFRHMGKEIGI